MLFSLPLLVTYFRIGLIPVLVILFFIPWPWMNLVCAGVFIAASLTDWLDGHLARKLNQMSRFGAFLDPVADKLMVTTALILLVQSDPTALVAIPAAIIVGREISISALREWMAEIGERAHVNVAMLGKVKTGFQMTAISMLFYQSDLLGIPIYLLGKIALVLAALLTMWSMFVYLNAAWPLMKKG